VAHVGRDSQLWVAYAGRGSRGWDDGTYPLVEMAESLCGAVYLRGEFPIT
jgi:hypothetical protein